MKLFDQVLLSSTYTDQTINIKLAANAFESAALRLQTGYKSLKFDKGNSPVEISKMAKKLKGNADTAASALLEQSMQHLDRQQLAYNQKKQSLIGSVSKAEAAAMAMVLNTLPAEKQSIALSSAQGQAVLSQLGPDFLNVPASIIKDSPESFESRYMTAEKEALSTETARHKRLTNIIQNYENESRQVNPLIHNQAVETAFHMGDE